MCYNLSTKHNNSPIHIKIISEFKIYIECSSNKNVNEKITEQNNRKNTVHEIYNRMFITDQKIYFIMIPNLPALFLEKMTEVIKH